MWVQVTEYKLIEMYNDIKTVKNLLRDKGNGSLIEEESINILFDVQAKLYRILDGGDVYE